jgi:hypothetical protein
MKLLIPPIWITIDGIFFNFINVSTYPKKLRLFIEFSTVFKVLLLITIYSEAWNDKYILFKFAYFPIYYKSLPCSYLIL